MIPSACRSGIADSAVNTSVPSRGGIRLDERRKQYDTVDFCTSTQKKDMKYCIECTQSVCNCMAASCQRQANEGRQLAGNSTLESCVESDSRCVCILMGKSDFNLCRFQLFLVSSVLPLLEVSLNAGKYAICLHIPLKCVTSSP